MTPEEKAEELISKFKDIVNESDFHVPEFICGVSMKSDEYEGVLNKETMLLAKECALICVDEIISSLKESINGVDALDIIYWRRVKQNINKL